MNISRVRKNKDFETFVDEQVTKYFIFLLKFRHLQCVVKIKPYTLLPATYFIQYQQVSGYDFHKMSGKGLVKTLTIFSVLTIL